MDKFFKYLKLYGHSFKVPNLIFNFKVFGHF